MEALQTPADMQSYILEQLTKAATVATAEPDSTHNRMHEKYAAELAGQIDIRLKDRIYHLIDARALETSVTETIDFLEATAEDTAVSILTDEVDATVAILRYEARFADILARLYFGGETQSPVSEREKPLTPGELGLLRLFACSMARTIESRTAFTENVTTQVRKDIDLEEVVNGELVLFKFEIELEAGKFQFEMAIPEAYVSLDGTEEEAEGDSANDEFRQVRIPATVRLNAASSTLKIIRSLKVGDCLTLTEGGKLSGQVMVKGQELFEGEIGRSGDAYSIKISNPVATKGKLDALSSKPFGAPRPPQF